MCGKRGESRCDVQIKKKQTKKKSVQIKNKQREYELLLSFRNQDIGQFISIYTFKSAIFIIICQHITKRMCFEDHNQSHIACNEKIKKV